MGNRTLHCLRAAAAGLSLWIASGLAPANAAEFGETSVFAQIPVTDAFPDGFPEGIAVKGNKVYVAGPAIAGTSVNNHPSKVFEFDRNSGALLRTIRTVGETVLGAEHANTTVAFDGNGRLYVVNSQLGIYRLDLPSATQTSYSSPLPDLPPCLLGLLGPACAPSPAGVVMPPLPNDLAFDDNGYAYVTDSTQATIWRIPPGGGAPQIWFQDSRLGSAYIGVNGLRLSPDRSKVFITVTIDPLVQGYVYTLPLVTTPKAADLRVFHHYPSGGPDGLTFGASGRLYVMMAEPGFSGISILNPDGSEYARLQNSALNLLAPYDSPANLAFDGHGNALVTNHAYATGNVLPQQFRVIRVFVDDTASPLATPHLP